MFSRTDKDEVNMTNVRIAACLTCKTMEELPGFEGIPEHDEVLAAWAARHWSGGISHGGQVFVVDEKDWALREKRTEIEKQIRQRLDPEAETGLGSDAYNMVETFKDDAMTCWGKHLNTPDCNDYKTPEKRLVPDTREERRELGLAPAAQYDSSGRDLTKYLCDYCPVHSMVIQKKRKDAGLYGK